MGHCAVCLYSEQSRTRVMHRNVVGNSTAQAIIYRALFMDTADFWSCFWDCHDEHCPFSLVHAFLQFSWRVPGSVVLHRWVCAGLVWACLIHALGIGNILWISCLDCLWFCCSSWICERQTRLFETSEQWVNHVQQQLPKCSLPLLSRVS